MVVDRDLQQHSSLVAARQKIPYTVTMVGSESQIFNQALLQNPDLILLNLRMPELLGLKVAIMLKENPSIRNVSIIFFLRYTRLANG